MEGPFFGTIIVIGQLPVGGTYPEASLDSESLLPGREVNVTKSIQTTEGLRYCPSFYPGWVLVNGKEEHQTGAYHLSGTKAASVCGSAGKDAADRAHLARQVEHPRGEERASGAHLPQSLRAFAHAP